MSLTPWSLAPKSWPGPLLLIRAWPQWVGQTAAETRPARLPEVRCLLLAWSVSDPAAGALGLEHTR